MPRVLVVVDRERVVADALAAGLAALLGDAYELRACTSSAAVSGADAAVVSWPIPPPAGLPAVVLLGAAATEAHAARAHGQAALVRRTEPLAVVADAVRLVVAGVAFTSPAAGALLVDPESEPPRFTPAERRIIRLLATRPDTRSRLALSLQMSPSTLDTHLSNIKQKVLATGTEGPSDGFMSNEALIGWANRQGFA